MIITNIIAIVISILLAGCVSAMLVFGWDEE